MIQSIELRIQELRVGNKVQDGNGFIFDVVAIHYDDTVYCDFKGNEGGLWEFDKNNPCQGIALTEEILLKCGFKKAFEGGTLLYLNNFNVSRLDYIYWSNVKLTYLNQLQNLYFALTNEELQINL